MKITSPYFIGAVIALLVIFALGIGFSSGVLRASTMQGPNVPSDVTLQTKPSAEPSQTVSTGADGSAKNDDNVGTTRLTGVPAIQPAILDAAPNLPAFTEEDVRKFASRQTGGFGHIRVEGQAPSIDKIQFLTPSALRALTVEASDLNVDDVALLCYVVYSGDFIVQGPAGLEPVRYKHAMQVFDAHSGNLLTQVAYDRK